MRHLTKRIGPGHRQWSWVVIAWLLGVGIGATDTAVASPPGEAITEAVPVLSPGTRETRLSSQHVAAASSGRFVVVWTDFSDRTAVPLRARLFNADGTPRTDELLVEPAQRGTFYESTQPVSMNSRGEFAVGFVARGPSSRTGFTTDHVYVQRYDADGQPLGARIDVDEVPTGRLLNVYRNGLLNNPAIALNDAGEVVVAWTSIEYTAVENLLSLSSTNRLQTRRFRADGSADGPTTVIATQLVKDLNPELRIAMNPSGGYVVAYRKEPRVPVTFNQKPIVPYQLRVFPFHVQRFSADGRRVGPAVRLTRVGYPDSDLSTQDFAITYAANGDLVLAWSNAVAVGQQVTEQIMLQRFSVYGRAVARPVPVATRPVYFYPSSLSVSPLPSGGVAVSWPELPSVPSEIVPGVAYGRYFAANDVPLGDAFVIAKDIVQVHSTTDGRGNLVATFGDVFARVFQGP